MRTNRTTKKKELIDGLIILDRRHGNLLQELEQIRKERSRIIKEMKRQSNNIQLTRYQAADILEYNYYYMSRLKIPFNKGKIYYLDLLEWLKQYQPGRIKRVEKNILKFLKEKASG